MDKKGAEFCSETVCEHCVGTGRQIDDKRAGTLLAERRKALGISMVNMAQTLGLTPQHLNNLEKGSKHWNTKLIEKYVTACTPVPSGQIAG